MHLQVADGTAATLDPLAVDGTHATLRIESGASRYVLKLAAAAARPGLDYARTATAQELARRAGVPVAEVVASGYVGDLQYLLQEEVEGLEWRAVRPLLGPAEQADASAQIASALLALQSVQLPTFGALDVPPAPDGVVGALRERIALRIPAGPKADVAERVLHRHAALFDEPVAPTLTHDDLHHANLLFRAGPDGWRLAAVLDWDKVWAGPAESDLARMAFWDDMTDAAFWSVYRASVPPAPGWAGRALVHQLLWCLEYDVPTDRHRRDTARLVAALE
ncbi:phosphotransferase [uncultured Cellulomonas sp.]|uniref:phosphotransferase family protein n=1 Tax=uncultured Cellulomonas sp. TaxID=189682 RepID=UPI0028F07F0C|nr:phosphotransferase [uncultured Cellulomonas sp.]